MHANNATQMGERLVRTIGHPSVCKLGGFSRASPGCVLGKPFRTNSFEDVPVYVFDVRGVVYVYEMLMIAHGLRLEKLFSRWTEVWGASE